MNLLVAGATGQQGGAVCRAALAAGFAPVALVRRRDTAAALALAAAGVALRVADLDQPARLADALTGIDTVFSVHAMQPGRATREVAQGVALARAAAAVGVSHFVYSAALWTDRPSGVAHFDSKFQVRQAIAELGLPATVLEPGSFMENLLHPQTLRSVR